MRTTTTIVAAIIAANTLALHADGPPTALWERSWDPGEGSPSTAGLVRVSDDGFTYVATLSDDGPQTDIAILKYDAQGKLVWERIYNGPANGIDSPTDIEITAQGRQHRWPVGGQRRTGDGAAQLR